MLIAKIQLLVPGITLFIPFCIVAISLFLKLPMVQGVNAA
jgi:hypothetical protein